MLTFAHVAPVGVWLVVAITTDFHTLFLLRILILVVFLSSTQSAVG